MWAGVPAPFSPLSKLLIYTHDVGNNFYRCYIDIDLTGTSPQTVIVPCSDSDSSSVCPTSFSPVSDWEETLASIHSTQSGNGSSSGEAEEPGIGSHNSASSSATCEQSNPTPQ